MRKTELENSMRFLSDKTEYHQLISPQTNRIEKAITHEKQKPKKTKVLQEKDLSPLFKLEDL